MTRGPLIEKCVRYLFDADICAGQQTDYTKHHQQCILDQAPIETAQARPIPIRYGFDYCREHKAQRTQTDSTD